MANGVAQSQQRTNADLVYAGLNRQVLALDRYTGRVVWEWKCPKGTGLVSLLLDGDRLIVAVAGYIYCLDPLYGQIVWENPLKGYGTGFTTLASVHGSSGEGAAAAAIAQQRAAAAAAASGAGGAGAPI